MPLKKIHVFASHKGGSGKSCLCFQTACQYAAQHPEERVLVLDFTELGDLSKKLFGGVMKTESMGDEAFGGIFEILNHAEAVSKRGQGLFGWLDWRQKTFAFEEKAVQVSRYNENVPENLFLASSGAQEGDDVERTAEQRQAICASMRASLEASQNTWKVFCDTDGDRRPSPSTQLAYAFADYTLIPVEPDECDFDRLLTTVSFMDKMHAEDTSSCQIQMILWNRLQVKDGSKPSPIGYFTSTKVVHEVVGHLNQRLFDTAQATGDLFRHAREPNLEAFMKQATLMIRDYPDTVIKSSNATGTPFCVLQPGKVTTNATEFKLDKDAIENCRESVEHILAGIAAAEMYD